MYVVISLLAGALFGVGLTVARMVDPQKVLNFLDVAAIRTGGWDPTLLFVFAGALPVMFIAYRIQRGMSAPLLDPMFLIPSRRDLDAPLLVGSGLFGIGWGLAGICPGPAFTALALTGRDWGGLLVFIAAMFAGMALSKLAPRQPS